MTYIFTLVCLYHYLEPFTIYPCYHPSKHEQSTRQLLNDQRLQPTIDELFMIFTLQLIGKRPLTVVTPPHHKYARHGYLF